MSSDATPYLFGPLPDRAIASVHVRLVALHVQLRPSIAPTHRRISGRQAASVRELDWQGSATTRCDYGRTMEEDEIDLALELGHERAPARPQCPRELEEAIRPMRRQTVLVNRLDAALARGAAAAADEAELATRGLDEVALGQRKPGHAAEETPCAGRTIVDERHEAQTTEVRGEEGFTD